MLTFVSLPYEKDISLDSEVERLNVEYNLDALRIDIPIFTGVSLENIIKYEEKIEKMDISISDLCKRFLKRSGPYHISYSASSLSWNRSKYSCVSIDGCLALVSDDIEKIRTNYIAKETHHHRMIKDYEDAQRRTKGSLAEMEIGLIVGEIREYEFLREVYILVDKEEIERFENMLDSTNSVSRDAVEIVGKDECFVLYKALVIKSNEKEFRKILVANSFVIKETSTKTEGRTNKEKIDEFLENKDNLLMFISTHQEEVYSLIVHTKLLKLFIESIYRYGLPIKYLYLVCKEEQNTTKSLIKLSENWESERMVESEYEGQEDQDLNIANTKIGFTEDLTSQ
ncbi:V-type proton ATPase subunit C 2 [Nosema granulosis]|uniref:V-type proton ATPase subunit C n=1 Tax=Nosema granulosis TaxID=83296 RepID=A0A9P6KXL4_9MICR|nr:V-type proton ATPase subunit C 2 [Nosema granulosis]